MVRFRGCRDDDDQGIAPGGEVLDGFKVLPGHVLRRTRRVAYFHPEGLRAFGNDLADPPEPGNADPAAGDAAPEGEVFTGPLPGAHEGVGGGKRARQRKEKSDREVSNVFGEHVRGMAGAKAPAGDGWNIEAVEPDPEISHHAERRVVRKLLVRPPEVGRGDKHVAMRGDLSKLFFAHAVAVSFRSG